MCVLSEGAALTLVLVALPLECGRCGGRGGQRVHVLDAQDAVDAVAGGRLPGPGAAAARVRYHLRIRRRLGIISCLVNISLYIII